MIISSLCVAMMTLAIPAKKVRVNLEQPDGTVVEAYLCGDEHFHFYSNAEGEMLTKGQDGFYRAASEQEEADARVRWRQKQSNRNQKRAVRTEAKRRMAAAKTRSEFSSRDVYVGKKKGLVILVNFMNLRMKTNDPHTAFDEQFNKVGYDNDSHIGSVHDYFFDQSYGKFDLEFDVVGPVKVSNAYSYYGANDSDGQDKHPAKMVIEACKLVDDEVNFADYDWDGDGEVDQVFVIYAGYGEHAGAAASTIWPHEFDLESAAIYYNDGNGKQYLDGVTINTYAVSCELSGTTGTTMESIGTACHEFSHCLGLPDLYDTSGGNARGMGWTDLMDSGSYNGPGAQGAVPCGFSAYERNYAGWLEYKELMQPCTVDSLYALNDNADAYVIRNDGNSNEYFVIENRQSDRWFQYALNTKAEHGMLVTHIDYDETAWAMNEPNIVEEHQRVAYVPSSKAYSKLTGVLFPGSLNVHALTDKTHSNYGLKLFNKNKKGSHALGKPITDIKENDGVISFNFMGGGESAIEDIEKEQQFDAEYYTTSGARIDKPTSAGVYIIKKGNKTEKMIVGFGR